MLKYTSVSASQNMKPSEAKNASTPPNDARPKAHEEGIEADAYGAKMTVPEKVNIEQSLILALPSRASISPGHEEPLSYFIGSNVLDTHVQMYAEISTDHAIVATLSRDGENKIHTQFEPRSVPKPWRFSKESFAEIIAEAKVELEQVPDSKILKDE